MKKRNSKGRFTYDKNWYIRNYEKVLLLVSIVVLAYMYFVTIAEARQKPLELSCNDFLSPISCDEIYGFNNLDLNNEKTFTRTPNKDDIVQAPEKELSIEDKIRSVFGEDGDDAIKVFKCESGLRPVCNDGLNSNGSVDCGVPQINSVHGINRKWLLNDDISIRVAKQIFDRQGWNPWSCKKVLGE